MKLFVRKQEWSARVWFHFILFQHLFPKPGIIKVVQVIRFVAKRTKESKYENIIFQKRNHKSGTHCRLLQEIRIEN